MIRLVIRGKCRTKKNHGRIVHCGKFPKILPSEAYQTWAATAVPQLRIAWAGKEPIDFPVNISAVFYREKLTGDAVGYYQAIADILELAGVVEDDKWLVSWDHSRLDKDANNPRVEIVFTPLVT